MSGPSRPGPLLPRRGEGERALVFVVAVLALLACLAAVAALSAGHAAARWRGDLSASATAIVRPRADETPAEAAGRAAEALAGVKGVAEARALSRTESERLLEPWIGRDALPEDLPIPQLVAVELNREAPASVAALSRALKAAAVDAVIDDHGRWLAEVRRAASAVQASAAAAGLLIGAAAFAVIAFATRGALAARREVVEVLHLAGAQDRYVAGLFQARFAGLAAAAGLLGALAACGLVAALKLASGAGGFTPDLPLAYSDLLIVLPCPGLAALAAAWAARRTALAILRRGDETW